MKQLLLLLLVICYYINIQAQTTISFPPKSSKLDDNVMIQLEKAYYSMDLGEELIISVLTSKELKKMANKDLIGFSRSRVNKLADYCKDTLLIHPLNIQQIFSPIEKKGKVLSGTNASYRNFTNRNGITKLALRKAEIHELSGVQNNSFIEPVKKQINQDYPSNIYGTNVLVTFPSNAFNCDCKEVDIELEEYFEVDDILLAGLTTTSNNKTLETGGMIYIMAYCNKEKVELRNNKKIKIIWNKEISNKKYKGFLGTRESKIINWELNGNVKAEISDITPQFSEVEEFNKTEFDKFIITSNKLGWINADFFPKEVIKTNLLVNLGKKSPNVYTRLVFTDMKTVLPGYFIENSKSIVSFAKIPYGKKTSLLVYEIINKTNIKWAMINFTTGDKKVIDNVELSETTISEFKKITNSLW